MRIMTVRATIYLAFLVATLMIAAQKPLNTTKIEGRIIAYRPVERSLQVASYAPNKEVFLLATEGSVESSKPMILKINYTHFGYSDIKDDILEKGRLLAMQVSRNPACDESFAHFLSTSRPITVVDDKAGRREIGKPVIFTAGFKGDSFSPDLNLDCYDLQKGNFKVIQSTLRAKQ